MSYVFTNFDFIALISGVTIEFREERKNRCFRMYNGEKIPNKFREKIFYFHYSNREGLRYINLLHHLLFIILSTLWTSRSRKYITCNIEAIQRLIYYHSILSYTYFVYGRRHLCTYVWMYVH